MKIDKTAQQVAREVAARCSGWGSLCGGEREEMERVTRMHARAMGVELAEPREPGEGWKFWHTGMRMAGADVVSAQQVVKLGEVAGTSTSPMLRAAQIRNRAGLAASHNERLKLEGRIKEAEAKIGEAMPFLGHDYLVSMLSNALRILRGEGEVGDG